MKKAPTNSLEHNSAPPCPSRKDMDRKKPDEESNLEDHERSRTSLGGQLSPARASEERRAAMPPCTDSTTSPRRKRRAESSEGDSAARESSRLRLDDLAEQPEETKNRSVDDTNESFDAVASDDFDPRPLSPASLRRSWVQQSIARGDVDLNEAAQIMLLHQTQQQVVSGMMPANRGIMGPSGIPTIRIADPMGGRQPLQLPTFGDSFVPYAASLSHHPLLSSISMGDQAPPFELLVHPSDALLHGAPMAQTHPYGSGGVLNAEQSMQVNRQSNLFGSLLAPPEHPQDSPILPPFASSFAAAMPQQQDIEQGLSIHDDLYSSSASLPGLSSRGFIPLPFGTFSTTSAAHTGLGTFTTLPGNRLRLSQLGGGRQREPLGQMGTPGRYGEEWTSPIQTLDMEHDTINLSPYQCEVRKQIELFAAKTVDVETSLQGRIKPIVLGQVGIRCRHCAMRHPRNRSRGSTFYPSKLESLYQSAQNMATSHLCKLCDHIPPEVRNELIRLREERTAAGRGKQYWADGAKELGVVEDEERGILRFREQIEH